MASCEHSFTRADTSTWTRHAFESLWYSASAHFCWSGVRHAPLVSRLFGAAVHLFVGGGAGVVYVVDDVVIVDDVVVIDDVVIIDDDVVLGVIAVVVGGAVVTSCGGGASHLIFIPRDFGLEGRWSRNRKQRIIDSQPIVQNEFAGLIESPDYL